MFNFLNFLIMLCYVRKLPCHWNHSAKHVGLKRYVPTNMSISSLNGKMYVGMCMTTERRYVTRKYKQSCGRLLTTRECSRS